MCDSRIPSVAARLGVGGSAADAHPELTVNRLGAWRASAPRRASSIAPPFRRTGHAHLSGPTRPPVAPAFAKTRSDARGCRVTTDGGARLTEAGQLGLPQDSHLRSQTPCPAHPARPPGFLRWTVTPLRCNHQQTTGSHDRWTERRAEHPDGKRQTHRSRIRLSDAACIPVAAYADQWVSGLQDW